MIEAQVLKKFASAVINLAERAQTISDAAANLKQMQKEASDQPTFAFDAEKLEKTASAVASLYGDRAAVNKDTLLRVWNSKPNTVVDSLLKVASDAIARKVNDQGIVAVKKTASHQGELTVGNKRNSVHDSFNKIYGIR